jgi:small-conductance mechanosensitive channel
MSDEENNSSVRGITGSMTVGIGINSILLFENEQLKTENLSLKEKIKEMSEAIKTQRTEILNKDAEISRLFNDEISILKDDNKTLKEQNVLLRNENNELKQKLEVLQKSNNKLDEDHKKLNIKFEKLDEDHKNLNEDHKKLNEDHEKLNIKFEKHELNNQILQSQSFAIDLKNNVIDYFIYINKDDELFRNFYQKKQYGKKEIIKIKRNDFFQFCNDLSIHDDELKQIEDKFSNFTNQKLSFNDPSFMNLIYHRNNNNLTHPISNLSFFKYNLCHFLQHVKSKADEMHPDIKDTHIMKLYDILNVSKFRKYLLYSLFKYFLISKEHLIQMNKKS